MFFLIFSKLKNKTGTRQLSIRDADTSPDDLVFSLLNAPNHGNIIKIDRGERETKLKRGDRFTYRDVCCY